MFTVKIYYAGGQAYISEAVSVRIGNQQDTLFMDRGGIAENLKLDGTEAVYIENYAGKTVEMIRPKRPATPAEPTKPAEPVTSA